MTKRNTFTDFIDATEGLLAQGFGKRGEWASKAEARAAC